MTAEKQPMGNPLEDFKVNMGKLGGNRKAQTNSNTDVQSDRKEDKQPDREEDRQLDREEARQIRKEKQDARIKTGYSLNRNLIKQARRLAIDEEVDVNDLIEEGLRLVFEDRKKKAGS